jgi:hypothetical protein
LTFGGYEGESKMEMYKLLPPNTFPKSVLINAGISIDEAACILQSTNLSFPVAVKPDVGRMGLMFRKINSVDEFIRYHQRMKTDYILQNFIDFPLEVSVFYYRFPDQRKGTITGFVKKERLSVTGDGVSSLNQLMAAYPRIQFRLAEMRLKHALALDRIIPVGQKYVLSDALNLSRGGRLISLENEKDERLLKLFDDLSHTAKFYFGRYDIKCASIEDLKRGQNFSILEFNGSGAEPHHVYGCGNSLLSAIKILLDHWEILYRISVQNRERGIRYWNFRRGLNHMREARNHIRLLKEAEFSASDSVGPDEVEEWHKKNVVAEEYELT